MTPKAKKCSEFQAILGYGVKACLKWGEATGEIARGLKYSPFLEKTLVQLLLPTQCLTTGHDFIPGNPVVSSWSLWALPPRGAHELMQEHAHMCIEIEK